MNRNSLVAVAATAFVAVTAGLGFAGPQSAATQTKVAPAPAATESFVYFPAQYALDPQLQVSEHIQAF